MNTVFDPLTADLPAALDWAAGLERRQADVDERAAELVAELASSSRAALVRVLTFIDNLPDDTPLDGDVRAALKMLAAPQPK